MTKKYWVQQAKEQLGELCDGIDLSDAWGKYRIQTSACVDRNRKDANGNPIRMRMTFVEWLRVWLESGHWHERGVRKGCYVMSRHNDLGHYEVDNVSIIPHSQNTSDACLGKPLVDETKKKLCLGRKDRIQVVVHGVEYPSVWAAVRGTGLSRRYIDKHLVHK